MSAVAAEGRIRHVVHLRPPRPLPRPAEPRPELGQSAFACPFCPHLKHSMLLMSRPAGLRPPLSDVKRSRLASSLTGLGALGDGTCPRLFRDSCFLADISRFVSRMRSAVGSSESYSSDDDSVSPSDPSAFSNTGFWHLSARNLERRVFILDAHLPSSSRHHHTAFSSAAPARRLRLSRPLRRARRSLLVGHGEHFLARPVADPCS